MTKARVLVVEDESVVAMDIRQRLSQLDYEVVGVANRGELAVELTERLKPDLVLMDIRLQGDVDGVDAAEQIRQRLFVPVVYLTAHADEATLQRAKVTEPFGYILKPFEDRELHTVTEMALAKHQAEKKLRESQRRYATTLNSIGDGVIATDAQGRVTFLNAVAEKLLGWPLAEAAGLPLAQIFHIHNEQTRKPVDNPVDRVLQLGTVVGLANHTILVNRLGHEIPVEDCAAPIHNDQGQCTGVVLVFRDATERRRLEAQVQQGLKMEAIAQLAGGLAHDFNNLLTIVNGYSDLLLVSMGPEHAWYNLVSEINQAGQRAADLTRQLLAFSRRQMLQPRALNLNQIVAQAEKMLRRLVGDKVELTLTLEPEVPHAKVDPGQIDQVLINLITNARDAMPHGGKLTISTCTASFSEQETRSFAGMAAGTYACLCVQDTGHGMTPTVKARLFEPFFTTKEIGKGKGLGLATVYSIVKQSNGFIQVDSQEGQGCLFCIYLPAALEEAKAPEALFELPDLPKGTETILLVEDEDGLRTLSRRILQSCGYTILEASHGIEGLQVSASYAGHIDLLLTDVLMPKMNGCELRDLLVTQRPGIKVAFMTGFAQEEVLRSGEGALPPLLLKPFSPLALARIVRQTLDQ